MIKKLLEELFKKMKNEKDLDNKSKNGVFIYFVEKILDEKYKKPNYISSKTMKGYFEKYVEEKENKSGEPSSELKDIIADYLGYTNFLDFETNNSKMIIEPSKNKKISFSHNLKRKWLVPTLITTAVASTIHLSGILKPNNCIIWQTDHYEEVHCDTDFSIPIIKNVNIKTFKKIEISKSTIFFTNGKPVIWYGKSLSGELEYFNSRGVHPITGEELKPITKYIVDKYIYKNINQ